MVEDIQRKRILIFPAPDTKDYRQKKEDPVIWQG
jgi:hypothetical protein